MKTPPLSLIILASLSLISASVRADSPSTNTAPADTTTAPTGNVTRVACIGDSITFGARSKTPYPTQLQTILGDKWVVKNFGVSGRTLLKKGDHPYWIERAFQMAKDFKPDVVIIMLGTNDTKPQNWAHHDEFSADYKELVESFKNLDSKPKVFVCLPPPVFPPGNYGINEENLDIEMPIIKQLATDEQAGVIDTHAPLEGKPELARDHVHPSEAGDALIAQAVADALTGKTAATP